MRDLRFSWKLEDLVASIFGLKKMEAARSSGTLVSCHIITWHHNLEDCDLSLESCVSRLR
jgi:hypothetical protein